MSTKIEITPMKEWGLGLDGFVTISGPCSAESPEQLLSTCRALKESSKVNMFRAGIWKPRTRPNNFEGIGEDALNWFSDVKKELKLPITCEVANASHVDLALKHNIDMIWIGARTTVNPFSVQEIADAVKGVDIPIMVKNPINSDLPLWIGALERLSQAGITKLAGIHRGFSTSQKSIFRNVPQWALAIDFKRLIPGIELLCDPSHIAGSREIIAMVSQKAIDLDMEGLMIESHIDPSIALSDKEQQLQPKNLIHLIEKELIYRTSKLKDEKFIDKLDELRTEIDKIDEELLELLGTRMKISREIGEYKKKNKVTILQLKRWEEIIRKRRRIAQALGLSERFMEELLKSIHGESIRQQEEIMN